MGKWGKKEKNKTELNIYTDSADRNSHNRLFAYGKHMEVYRKAV